LVNCRKMSEKVEIDYMSDMFLNFDDRTIAKSAKRFGRKTKSAENFKKSIRKIEEENRIKGLSKKIPKTNIGHKLLSKMGYQEGKGLGKQKQGKQNPIPLYIRKRIKDGLGHLSRNDKTDFIISEKTIFEDSKKEDFRLLMQEKHRKTETSRQFLKFLRILDGLRTSLGNCDDNENLAEIIGWNENSEDGEIEDFVENLNLDKLLFSMKNLIGHLRKKYFYCVYCVRKFSNFENLKNECPGDGDDDH
ncbi:G patch domain-containing protein 11, partial [Bonamia ostreae]